jgi:phenylacetate-coenzyme A ligase PaaK-like adenylate-forming protein
MSGLQWNHKIFNVKKEDFASLALEIFRLQANGNPVYRAYLNALQVNPVRVESLDKLPFLPIRFFKSHRVVTGEIDPQQVFESSGTTGMTASKHYVSDLGMYEESFIRNFERHYGSLKECCILGLLPSYIERQNSSLVYMVEQLVRGGSHPLSGFYMDDFEKLAQVLTELEAARTPTFLIGVSFALLDLAERFPMKLKYTTIMETGGMKGRREELIREELHAILSRSFGVENIHSEYGMTELLSQAYSNGKGIFHPPSWMKIILRDEEDPFTLHVEGKPGKKLSGAINVIDLANIHSCSFIATDDIGRLHENGSFEMLGRMDGSDLRGCSLLVAGNDQ